jgi:hypothetical protein
MITERLCHGLISSSPLCDNRAMAQSSKPSAATLLRAFQRARQNIAGTSERDDLAMLQSKDLDLSVRLGALLAFDALIMTAAINPIAASPGAPLSLDAPSQPLEVAVISLSIALLAVSAYQCVRGILIGEEFDIDGVEEDGGEIMRRMFGAYCASIDAQMRMISSASRYTIAGGAVAALGCLWIMAQKILG